MPKITIVANITAKTGKIDLMKSELLKLVESTRTQDEGCISYDLHQDNENPAEFMVFEIWASEDLLQKHADSEHFKAFMGASEEMVELFTVNKMTQIA